MTAAQFAKIAKVSKGTVLHWIRKGELPATQVRTERGPGYEIEMDDAQALEWLAQAGKLYTFSESPTRPEAENPKSEPAPAADSALVEQLRSEVSFLRSELERRGEELRKRAEIEHLKDAFIQELVERTKALPAPEPTDQKPESPKRRRWRLFGGRDQ
jgi:excisionase family DNA binding protein